MYDTITQSGSTALHFAVRKENIGCLEILLSHNAEMNIINDVRISRNDD